MLNTWRYVMYSQAGKIWRRDFRDGEIQNLRRKQNEAKRKSQSNIRHIIGIPYIEQQN